MKKGINIFIVVFVCLFFFSFMAYAEKIIMNDGTEYEGNIHHEDDSVVFIVCKEDLIKLNKSDIKEIIKEDNSKKKTGSMIDNIDNTDVIEDYNETIIQIGYDVYGKYFHKGHEDETDSINGLTFAAKYYHYFIDEFGVGCGINFQNSRELEDIPGEVYFVPTYISLKLRSVPTEPYKYGYAVANIGYNFFFPVSDYDTYLTDEKGGLFYSIGLGIVYNRFLFEVTGAVHSSKAKIKSTTYDIDIEYKTYTFSVGYVF